MPRKGSQVPTFSTVGEWSYSDGDYAIDMFRDYGATFYPSQEMELRTYLARNEDSSFASTTICVSKPRQNGKSYAARFYAIWMSAIEGKAVLYSAHNGDTVRKMFKACQSFIEGNPDFYEMLKPNGKGIYAAKGTEGIYFVDENGNDAGFIEFQTRTNGKARGATYQIIIVDEAQELTEEHNEALTPTTFAASDVTEADSDPQMIFIGTPPGPKCPGTVFRDYHDKAHDDRESSIWWMEWAVYELPDMTDRAAVMELVYQTNPAMGYRIKERTMYEAMDKMSADGFAREVLGWWAATVKAPNAVIQPDEWLKCKVTTPKKEGLMVLAVRFDPSGKTASLAACYKPEDGTPFVFVVGNRNLDHGIGWFVDTITANWRKAAEIVIDGPNGAKTLKERLVAQKVPEKRIKIPSSGDAASAYSGFLNAVRERQVTHYGQPALDRSATGSERRKIGSGGGWGFASTEDVDASLIESCCWAYWGAMTTRRRPGRRAVVR